MKYEFSGRLNSKFPSQVMVDLTEVCNLGCIHCTHPDFKKSEIYSKRMLEPSLNSKMIREVAESGFKITKYIRYTSNGEPLVHPKSYDMILDAVKNSKTKVTLTTNGTLLNEKKMKKLLETGLHMIDISIDAFNQETYSKVRIGGNLEVTRRNVLKLIDMNLKLGKKTKIIVSFVEQNENTSEINQFKNFWSSQKVDDVLIRKLHTNSGSLIKNDEKKKSVVKRYPCLYPWERIILNARGQLAFCPTDWYAQSEISDYKFCTIKDIWSNNFYNDLRNQHIHNKFKNNLCKNCPDWKNTSWPLDKNKSYADLVEKILYES